MECSKITKKGEGYLKKKLINKKMLKHKENLNVKKIKLINFISFLFGFSASVSGYIIALYFKQTYETNNIGVFYLISYIIILVLLLNLHKIVKRFGKSWSLCLFLFIKVLAALALVFLDVSLLGSLFIIVYIITLVLSFVNIDIVLESFSSDRMSGRIRGIYLTVLNAGFILGPFISMRLLDKFNFNGVFFVVFIFDLIIFLIAISKLQKVNHEFNRSLTIFKLIEGVLKRPNIVRVYYISFVLDFFYAMVTIYSFLYLLNIGMSLNDIGIIFTIMLLPFVLLQYPIGVLADKKTGEKELLIFSLLILGVSTLSIYFIESTSIIVWSIVLLTTRIGAALIEILRDSYFYKRIDGHDVDLIDFFRTTKPVAYILFAIISIVMLIYLPMKSIFVLTAVIAFLGIYPAFRLVDNKCEEEMKGHK